MRGTKWSKLAAVLAAGALTAAGFGVAGAVRVAQGDPAPETLPEPAQRGQSFAAAMEDWATCVADAAAAIGTPDAATTFDPFVACGELPHPEDFDIVGDFEALDGEENGGENGDENGGATSLPEPAVQGQAFAAAMRDWAQCVSDAASALGSDPDAATTFDPLVACGELPHPSDFGIGGGIPEWAPGPPPGVPAPLPDQATSGPPEGVSTGPPARTQSGAPAGTPSGAPEWVPTGPPAGIPAGRP